MGACIIKKHSNCRFSFFFNIKAKIILFKEYLLDIYRFIMLGNDLFHLREWFSKFCFFFFVGDGGDTVFDFFHVREKNLQTFLIRENKFFWTNIQTNVSIYLLHMTIYFCGCDNLLTAFFRGGGGNLKYFFLLMLFYFIAIL